jgi:hypothetical protein
MAMESSSNTFYASPTEALSAKPEEFLYVGCLHEGTGVEAPDFLAVVDTDPASSRYGTVIHETPMPNVGDELHHYGWNRCSSACHGPDRSHLIVPGFRSSRIHIIDVGDDPLRPRVERVIEPDELVAIAERSQELAAQAPALIAAARIAHADGDDERAVRWLERFESLTEDVAPEYRTTELVRAVTLAVALGQSDIAERLVASTHATVERDRRRRETASAILAGALDRR